MATSGTVARTSLDVATLIEHAIRKCGVLTSSITGEQLRTARENLFLLLTSLTNRGLNLWCVSKQVQPVIPLQAKYPLWAGTVDILKALYRYGTYTAATTFAGPIASVNFGTPTQVSSVTVVVPVAGTYNLVLESSPDGATWTNAGTTAMLTASAVGDLLAVDAENYPQKQYWRVRETLLSVTFAAATFLSSTTEIEMGKLNRDDYLSYPNKQSPSGTILQYWFDKQITPNIWLWPVAQIPGPQVVLTTQRQIQDVGALSNTLDMPSRWELWLIHELGAMTCLELPSSQVPQGRFEALTDRAAFYYAQAADGETDGMPVRITPNIGHYTS